MMVSAMKEKLYHYHVLIFFAISTCNSNKILYMNIYIAPFSTIHIINYKEKYVTCGSAIKLTHVESGGKSYLSSSERQLQSGSGQQLVTVEQNNRAPRGLWQVREANGAKFCEGGTLVKCGQVIRLMHLETGANLHTHGIRSPLSNQHEVTGFGQQGDGDTGDDWMVVCEAGGSYFGG